MDSFHEFNMHEVAHRLATDLGLSATYDSHYLATAAHHGATFWTSDKELVALIGDRLDSVRYLPRIEG